MARLTAEPIPPELLSTCSMAGASFLQKQHCTLSGKDGVLLRDSLDFSERFLDALDGGVRFPAECVAAEARGELPFIYCSHCLELAFEIILLMTVAGRSVAHPG